MFFQGHVRFALLAPYPNPHSLLPLLLSPFTPPPLSTYLPSYAQENVWFFKAVDEMKGKPASDLDFVRDAEFLISTYLSPDR